ncbi:UFD4 [Sanghuangporus sanghuang]
MDFERINNQVASSSSSHTQNTSHSSTSNAVFSERTPVRSSSRLKAAKENGKDREEINSSTDQPSRRIRDHTGKGKRRDTSTDHASAPVRTSRRAKRATQPPTASSLVINESAKDIKGKKRANPESISEDESTPTSSKRARRSKKGSMPKKATARTSPNGKNVAKSKPIAAPGPSRPEEDEQMMDVDYDLGGREHDEHMHGDEDHSDEDEMEKSEDDHQDGGNEKRGEPATEASESRRTLEETMAMFDFGRMGGFMSQVNTRLRTLLNNIKPTADPTTRLVALQELSELLSISTEDTLAGSFQIESFVRELVRILGGSGEAAQDEADDDDDDDEEATDEDAALAAALAMSSGGAYAGDENLEAQLLACRCLANLMEALPGCGHTLVYHGAIPVLCSKLVEISYIDLAEQTLLTLEKISEEYPSAIVREGGLAALLNYLDFFSIAVQRTALQAAANCCRNFSPDNFSMIKDVWPIIRNCLGYADQRLVDYAALCVIRIIESYHRSHADKLEVLVDADLIRAVNVLLLPAGGSPVVSASTYTQLVKVLGTAARASPTITLTLLQADIVTTIYQILTGVLPPSSAAVALQQGDSGTGQGLGGGLADMTVMQNLAHRPKELVEEALTLVSELMPPLPRDGTFDHKGYSEKAFHRMIKAKNRVDRAAARAAAANATISLSGVQSASSSRAQTPTAGLHTPGEDDSATPAAQEVSDVHPAGASAQETSLDRATLLRQHEQIMNRFITPMIPILVDVYAASVSGSVKLKALTSLLKAICFQDEEQLKHTLKNVPIASFASSILSAKDNPNLMIGGLQMVELLLSKAPAEYRASFRREGVLHEIDILAARPLSPRIKDKDKVKEENKEDSISVSDTPPPPSIPIPAPIGSLAPGGRRPHLLDPEDAYTLRARFIKFKLLSNDVQDVGDATFTRLRHLVTGLQQRDASEYQLSETLQGLSHVLSSHQTISSFELLQSGLLDGLLEFATSKDYSVDHTRRHELMMEKLAAISNEKNAGPSPMAVLVKKLQESLSRIESFEVTTVASGMEDSKRSTPSLLARQIKLRLIPEDSSDSSTSNLVVSIHAIATFQALNDYLRPRLTGLLSTSAGSRLSGMLSALASGRFGADVLSAGGLAGFSSALSAPPPPPEAQPQARGDSMNDSAPKPERRRSQRLSAKASAASISENARVQASSSVATPSAASTSTVVAPQDKGKKATSRSRKNSSGDRADEETLADDDDDLDSEGDFMDADIDAEVFEDEGDHDHGEEAEKTVTLSVADDGSKVVAQTPEGTRVATPNPAVSSAGPSSGTSIQRPSYAAALKNKPTDWHLEFSMDGHVLPLDMTIYGAIHHHEARKASGNSVPLSMLYSSVFPVKYKKVPGPAPPPENNGETSARARSPVSSLASLPDDAPHSKILKLLRVLHRLNAEASESTVLLQILPESAFINNKLTAKLTRQLEEPMIVASACLPEWAMDLPLHFPFLFPFSTRFNFLQSTSFGYARLILRWQSQNRAQESSRRDDQLGFLGRLQRQKVRISRRHILESAFKVFELYGSSSSILEVEYFDEVGTGLGPTLEFYSLVSREFARRDLKIWRDDDMTYPGVYVHHPHGLFPAPVSTDTSGDGGEKRMYIFKIIGQFVAKAMLDSRIIDMSFNKVFLKMILGEEIPMTIGTLRLVDPALANSLAKLESFVQPSDSDDVKMDLGSVEDMMLDFTLPGYDIDLRPGGKNIPVTSQNVKGYIQEVINATIGRGAELQARAFREGFSKVFPVPDLQAFSADELGVLFGNAVEDWSIDTLMESMKADHGFNMESPAVRDLVYIMSKYDEPSRRRFLQFITGSPKLPIGGFRGLSPPFTVVRKPHEAPLSADDYLPSVMTCVNYLKLPQYSSRDAMRERLETAISEGVGCFHLS